MVQVLNHTNIIMSLYYTQAKLLDKFRLNNLILSGDGRCDSPGKSAKFCTYSMMETTDNQILHFENVDKREVGLQSPNMEREGIIRCLNFLLSSGMKISEVVTDSSTSVAKTLGNFYKLCALIHNAYDITIETDYPAIHHSRDVWHKAKKLRKALSEVFSITSERYFILGTHIGWKTPWNE